MGASLMNSTISLDDIYPVGSIYMNINSTNPTDLFGGVWEQIKERFILGCGDTHTAGTTGGEFSHTLTVDEMPSHKHVGIDIDNVYYLGWENGNLDGINYLNQYQNFTSDVQNKLETGYTGGSQPHNITPPLPCGLYLAKNSITILRGRYYE